ncbi:MAG: TRAP transporter substrate-binding protein DctP [Lachnospiraceae bacterium]
MFTALQQGTIDGHDNSISTIVSNNVQEIQPYMTVSRHTYEAFTWMANTANFTSKLSEEDQQLVFDLVEQACKEVNAEIVAEEEELIAQCEEENGVQFYRFTDEDVETWRAVITRPH